MLCLNTWKTLHSVLALDVCGGKELLAVITALRLCLIVVSGGCSLAAMHGLHLPLQSLGSRLSVWFLISLWHMETICPRYLIFLDLRSMVSTMLQGRFFNTVTRKPWIRTRQKLFSLNLKILLHYLKKKVAVRNRKPFWSLFSLYKANFL